MLLTFIFTTYRNTEHPKFGLLFKISLYSIFIGAILFFSFTLLSNLYPKEWDFTCFYIFGKVSRYGLDFYNPADYVKVLNYIKIPFELSNDFKIEVIDVGCLYPPQTLLLFLPLGYMSYMQAMYFFYGLILISVIGCLIIIKSEFFKDSKFNGWMIATIILLLTKPLLSTIVYTQTLIFLLLFVLLIYKYKDNKYSGIFLAFAIIIKPFAIVLLVYFLFKKQWQSIMYFVYTMGLITFITVLMFGIQPFINYFLSNPSIRLPLFFFTETTNQSVLAGLYRTFPQNLELAKLINYCISSFLLLLGGYIIYYHYKKKGNTDYLFGLLFSIMLLIYPTGQVYYPIVHILSLFIIVKYFSNYTMKNIFIVVFFIVLSFGLLYTNILILLTSIAFIFPNKYTKITGNLNLSKQHI